MSRMVNALDLLVHEKLALVTEIVAQDHKQFSTITPQQLVASPAIATSAGLDLYWVALGIAYLLFIRSLALVGSLIGTPFS